MLGDKVPDKFWLGVPLHRNHCSYLNTSFSCMVHFGISHQVIWKYKHSTPYRAVTKPSEQVTIFQLQGSTEVSSQLWRTPRGSTSESLMLPNAITEKITQNYHTLLNYSKTHRICRTWSITFHVDTFGCKGATCTSPQAQKSHKAQSFTLLPDFHWV